MIRKLKIKFVILSALSLIVLLSVLVVGMNLMNYQSIVSDVDDILTLLSVNRGTFPNFNPSDMPGEIMPPNHGQGGRLPPQMSPEIPYETRFFSVLLNREGKVLYTDVSRITSVDATAARGYAQKALGESDSRGFIGEYRFVRSSEEDTVRITFLDCGRRLESFYSFLYTSILIASVGFVLALIVIVLLANRIVRPIAESYEKQKRFITDAGHEIKTPLTIINANVDILEMELSENESLRDIQQQTKRLSALTNDLVYLARMEEASECLPMVLLPLSEIVTETAAPFKTLAQRETKTLTCDVAPMLSTEGNEKAVAQLVSLLLDNAIKYSPREGNITLSLSAQRNAALLTVENQTAFPIEPSSLEHVFDRFYRADPSRNSQTGGHGIGLSVAKAIVQAHGGKISASADGAYSFKMNVSLPLSK